MKTFLPSKFIVDRIEDRCIKCKVCITQCSFDTHYYDADDDQIKVRNQNCVGCHRCVTFCPTGALVVRNNPLEYRQNANWTPEMIEDIFKQAETGGVLLTGMGMDKAKPIYWDKLLINASQVTNPSIDPLREPMELTTYLGRKPEKATFDKCGNIEVNVAPQVKIDVPLMFSAMSYGAISLNVHRSLAQAAKNMGTMWNTGEGGLHSSLMEFKDNTIVQVASGRYGVQNDYLNSGRIVEIKIGQGAKPGIGGHLPGEKVSADVSLTRMIPMGTDAISPAPQHDIYSIEDLSQLIYGLKEATRYRVPISVKIAAVHNVAAIASGIVRAGADIVTIDGMRGATGAAPKVIRDNVGIPIELALAAVDSRLREEGIRNQASLVISGGIRNSGDVFKAIALGADAVNIGTAALVALGCHLCQQCHTGKCSWGICTSDLALTKRINPEIGAKRLSNLLRGWSLEIKDMLGGLGVNAIESLRGNRLHLRGVGLSAEELKILGVRAAGE
ncbi:MULTISPECIES: glutamate synthase-related protein [Dehalococcoides]|jgi:glutamate synthase (NADPH) GltB2 subunit (EC 1.4.1.13)|uniref:Archaeal-type glutamate synthase [NADPH] n=1 Tax=Dehalococcoides mccartyi TaxID=61435 RepID=A0A1S7AU43_9CHLR|nr:MULTISPECIES: glutamate synthase-related protein [Dehalococcoides]AGG06614.1 glutamate synthase, archaeal type, alpha subunit [Dehalococcoides mccartyi DCMB5]AQU06148.1 FMN-binding glutamate synthase family protein [Dehalococcoides mccartyi]AQU07591.1 FMN-binding glutamate synthase family protein [Dehalococcoides mccartyi]AQW62626.1 FMN-binding glutamate synthase family protein [Dehalococcoides mccartyi]AQX73418.1 FMN-binding glutamate synthase family protein [Dehalococcoides mccartyi]